MVFLTSQNNFSTTIKRIRLLKGMSMREFSEEIGIALSSLVEYEAGRRIPRGDTISHISERLNIPPSALISPAFSTDQSVPACLDTLALRAQSLHPHARASAIRAIQLLRSAFQYSEELFFMESRSARPENPNDRFRYRLHEFQCPPPVCGMLVDERKDDVWTTIASLAPFSDDRLAVLNAVYAANELQLPPNQFFSDVFHEFFPVL